MAVSADFYGPAFQSAFSGEVDLSLVKVMLLDATYTPDLDHRYLVDVSGAEITGTGYTAGGATVANAAVTYDAATNTVRLDGDDVTWANATLTARYAVLYEADGSSPLLVLVDFGADMSATNGDFQIVWDSTGIATVSVA